MSQENILRVEHLTKYYPVEKSFLEKALSRNKHFVKAVDDISFTVKRGEIFTLAGESGCGKTTTGKLVVRLISPTSGKIFFNDVEITELEHEDLRMLKTKSADNFPRSLCFLQPADENRRRRGTSP